MNYNLTIKYYVSLFMNFVNFPLNFINKIYYYIIIIKLFINDKSIIIRFNKMQMIWI